MIDMSDVVADEELAAPKPFVILRASSQWTQNGLVTTTVSIPQVGPVQRASAKEVQMLPEADRVESVMAFWCLIPVLTVRGKDPATAVQGVQPQGVFPGYVYTIDPGPVGTSQPTLYKNGLFQIPGVDYTYAAGMITMTVETLDTDTLYLTYVTNTAGAAVSDVIQYELEQYRVLSSKHYPGSGFWRALGTRLSTI